MASRRYSSRARRRQRHRAITIRIPPHKRQQQQHQKHQPRQGVRRNNHNRRKADAITLAHNGIGGRRVVVRRPNQKNTLRDEPLQQTRRC